MSTKRQQRRDQRAAEKAARAMRRADAAARQPIRMQPPPNYGPDRWMPIPGTDYECNTRGNVRKTTP